MALRLLDELEKNIEGPSPRPSLDDPRRYSVSSADEKLNELDPLHSNGHTVAGLEEYDADSSLLPRVREKHTNGATPSRGFLSRKEARARQIRKWKSRICVPGRLCGFIALVVALTVFLSVRGGGYHAYIEGTIDGHSPPWYPTPRGGTVKTWQDSYAKAAALVGRMSLAEKVNITTGTGWMNGLCVGNTGPATEVGFPALCLQDGPLGVRFADRITATPAGITVGATWNKDLMYKRGKLLGLEYKAKGVNVMLGPAIGPLGRMPAGGRNWEGFGSDPVLQGLAAAQTIKGIQEQGVMATIKHYVANEQEHFRQPYEWSVVNALSSNIGERTLHEVYAWPFADAIKAGVASVMCSYNQVNNSYACQNSKILNGLLKDELGFQGFVQSDWTAQHAGVDSALAGLDMAMPGGEMPNGPALWGDQMTISVLNGSLPMERLDDMVTRIVAAWYQLGQDNVDPKPAPEGEGGPNFSSWTNDEVGLIHPGTDDTTTEKVNHFVDAQNVGDFSHSSLVRRIAAEGTVLLKNSGRILPLSRSGWPQAVEDLAHVKGRKYRIAVVGEDAVLPDGGANVCPDRACNKGTLASGWGSGAVEFPYLISPLEGLQEVFQDDNVELHAFRTNDIGRLYELQEMDLCIVFANADAGEGYVSWESVKGDRNDLFLQKDGDKLIKTVAAKCGANNPDVETSRGGNANGGTIVVIHSVGPVILESFIELDSVHAVVFANLPGQESGHALTDILLGDVNPSGHLPFTIGKSLADYGPGAQIIYQHLGTAPQQDFDEGLNIDYRYFDSKGIVPRFPFGFGLSYTTFELEELTIKPVNLEKRPENLPPPRPQNECDPPHYDSPIPDPKNLLFPSNFRKLRNYIYPYINSVSEVKQGNYPYPDMTPKTPSAAGGGEGGNPALWEVVATVEVTVVNTGPRDGQAVVQLYIGFPHDVYEYYEGEEDDVGDHDESNEATSVPTKESLEDRDELTEDAVPSITTDTKETELNLEHSDSQPDGNPSTPALQDTEAHVETESDRISDGDLSDKDQDSSYLTSVTDSVTAATAAMFSRLRSKSEKITFPVRVLRSFTKTSTYTRNDGDGSDIFQSINKQPQMSEDEKVRAETKGQEGTAYGQHRKTVVFELTRRDLSYWSVRRQNWVLPDGSFTVEVGFSSRDLRAKGKLF